MNTTDMTRTCGNKHDRTLSQTNGKGERFLTRVFGGPELLRQIIVFAESCAMNGNSLSSLRLKPVACLKNLLREAHGVES